MFWLAEVFNGSISQEEMRRRELWAHQERAEMVRDTFSAAAGGVVRGLAGLGRGARAVYEKLHRWNQKRAAIRELDGLSDHLLKDIGLNRGEIRSAVETLLDGAPRVESAARRFPARPVGTRVSGKSTEQPEWQRAA